MADWEDLPEVVPARPASWESLPETPEAASLPESVARGAGQGVTLGWQDELAGLVAAYMAGNQRVGGRIKEMLGLSAPGDTAGSVYEASGVPEATQPEGLLDLMDEARKRGRDSERQANAKARASNPNAFLAGEVAGGLALPLPGAGAAKGATVAQRMAQFAKVGGATGLAAGAGASDDATASDAAIGGAVGAGIGAALPPAMKAAGAVAGPLSKAMRRGAESLAVKAITPTAGLTNRLRKLGYDTPEKARAFGRRLLDAGIIPAGGTPEAALERAVLELEDSGADIGKWLTKADELASAGATPPASRSLAKASARDRMGEWAKSDSARTVAAEEFPAVAKYMGTGTPDAPVPDATTFRNLWMNKSHLRKAFKTADATKLQQEARNAAVDGYTRSVYEQLEGAVGPDGQEAVRGAARRYAAAADAENLLKEAVSREAARAPVGLMDTQAGQVAASTGIPLAGPLVTAGSAALRSRLPSALARTLDAASGPAGKLGAFGPGLDASRPLRAVADYYALERDAKRNPRTQALIEALRAAQGDAP